MSSPFTAASSTITSSMVESLRQTKPWVRFLSILGFISVGLMVLAGLFMMLSGIIGGTMARSMGGAVGGAPILLMGMLYLLFAVLYIFPSLFLFRYASSIARMQSGETVSGMEEALAAQRSFWRFAGILAAIVMVLYLLLILFFIVVAVVTAVSR
jgi:hypothetical protein